VRILHISHLFPCYEGDLNGIAVLELIEPLFRMGIEMQMLCPIRYVPRFLVRFRPDLASYSRARGGAGVVRGVRTHYVKYLHCGSRRSLTIKLMTSAIYKYVDAQLDVSSFDIIHTHKALPDGVAAAALATRYSKPLILTVRETDLSPVWYRKRLERLLRSAQALATPSEMIREFVEKEFTLPIRAIYNGVNLPEIDAVAPFPRRRSDKDRFVILSVSSLIPRKGIQYVLMALKDLLPCRPNLKYIVVGDGPYRKNLERLARELGLTEYVEFVGRQPRRTVYSYMKMADLFCLPSWNETFGLVYVEAMACRLPVIGTKGHGIDGVIQNEKEGFLVEEKSTSALAQAISRLVDDPASLRNFGERGRSRVCQSLTWEASANKLQGLYRALM
jgi:teichuronic acid biosynthesis glycosyltransferase TuaC